MKKTISSLKVPLKGFISEVFSMPKGKKPLAKITKHFTKGEQNPVKLKKANLRFLSKALKNLD